MRSIKIVGATVLALFALSVAASSALANEWVAKEYPVRVTANQKSGEKTKFTVGSNAPVECEKTEYKSAEPEFLTKAGLTILFGPVYSSCVAFGFIGVEITVLKGFLILLTWNGSKLNVALKQSAGTSGGLITIIIKAVGCEITVPTGQEFTEGASAKNIAGGKIEAEFSIKKIKYTSNEKGTGCPKNGEEAVFSGKDVAEGFNSEGAADGIEI
jgi:hypothetical protein